MSVPGATSNLLRRKKLYFFPGHRSKRDRLLFKVWGTKNSHSAFKDVCGGGGGPPCISHPLFCRTPGGPALTLNRLSPLPPPCFILSQPNQITPWWFWNTSRPNQISCQTKPWHNENPKEMHCQEKDKQDFLVRPNIHILDKKVKLTISRAMIVWIWRGGAILWIGPRRLMGCLSKVIWNPSLPTDGSTEFPPEGSTTLRNFSITKLFRAVMILMGEGWRYATPENTRGRIVKVEKPRT